MKYIIASLIVFQFFFQLKTVAQTTKNQRTITADYNIEKGATNTMFKECIGAGRANEGLRADWQQQLQIAKAECDFKYIRMLGFHVHSTRLRK